VFVVGGVLVGAGVFVVGGAGGTLGCGGTGSAVVGGCGGAGGVGVRGGVRVCVGGVGGCAGTAGGAGGVAGMAVRSGAVPGGQGIVPVALGELRRVAAPEFGVPFGVAARSVGDVVAVVSCGARGFDEFSGVATVPLVAEGAVAWFSGTHGTALGVLGCGTAGAGDTGAGVCAMGYCVVMTAVATARVPAEIIRLIFTGPPFGDCSRLDRCIGRTTPSSALAGGERYSSG
jgi:hypothetical protein